jgi:RNA polymerase sigma-70 factor
MTEKSPKRSSADGLASFSELLRGQGALLDWLHAQSGCDRWGVPRERFINALERSAQKGLPANASVQKLEPYLRGLHLEDLALALACAEGIEAAWEHFFALYRPYLRAAAAAVLRKSSDSSEACELADSLFSDLYGLESGKGSERSLLRYFHGRSSLKTWLRAVLSQRHIDAIRAGRRFTELPEEESGEAPVKLPLGPPATEADPHRERYVSCFVRALQSALDALEPKEKDLLRLYYAEEKTLAEIAKLFGEHESSASRHLERVRRDLRQSVEQILHNGSGAGNGSTAQSALSEAEIALCFEYSAGDSPIDLEKLLPERKSASSPARKGTP